jgi:alcohol dehydrogenase
MTEADLKPQTFYMPTRVRFGEHVLSEHGAELAVLGKRALLITGKRSADLSGVTGDLIPVLELAGIAWSRFDSVPENPDWNVIRAACAQFAEFRADFVIGIGGGSPMDAAKAVALLIGSDGWHGETPDLGDLSRACPIVAIPTTSGTGSEVTPHSVITDPVAMRKGGVSADVAFPRIAYIDPRYAFSQPPNVTRDTAVDALSHLLEGLYSTKRNPMLFPFIYEGVALIYKHLPLCLDCPDDREARFMLSRAAMLGGIVIAHTGTTLQHALGYPLTMELGLSHGLANGVVLRQVMELYFPVLERELNILFRRLGITCGEFFNWLERLDMRVGQTISDDFLERRVPEVLEARNLNQTPIVVTDALIRRIYARLR